MKATQFALALLGIATLAYAAEPQSEKRASSGFGVFCPDGKTEDMEIRADEVPAPVMDALAKQVPVFEVSKESPRYQKSLRSSRNGSREVWYIFSGTNSDVEIRSDGKLVVITLPDSAA